MASVPKSAVWYAMLILGLAVVSRPAGAQELDEERKATKRVAPAYPHVARQAKLSGTVKMVVTITPEGAVKAVKTLGGNPVLVPAAEDAVKQWKFEVSKRETSSLVAISFGAAK